jgi:F0F1-type ATP synthase assembly protein I
MSSLKTWEALGIVTQFGVTCAVAVWLGFLLGNWIDGLVGTDSIHIFGLVGAIAGMIAAIISTLQLMKAAGRRADARRNQGQE